MAIIKNIIETTFQTKGAQKAAKATETIGRQQTRLGQTSASAGRQFSAQAAGMGGLVTAYAGAAANIFAITAAFSALSKAARAEETIAGVRTLAASVGESGDEVLAKLQEITQGQVSMAEAASSANLALSAGFSLDQIEGLATVAIKASKALGRDLTDSLNRLVRGAAKVEPEILDELGIIVRLDKAVEQYALKIGKAAGSLSLFERSQAFTNAIIEQGVSKFDDIDATAASSIKTFEQLSAKLADFAQQIGGLIAGALSPLIEFITGNFLNTLAAAGLLGGVIFQKLGEVGGAALGRLADRATTAGIAVTNFLGARGAATAANDLTKSMQGVSLSGKTMKGQLIGMTASTRKSAISLLQKAKTTRLTTAEMQRLNAALATTNGQLTTLSGAAGFAAAGVQKMGIAAKIASVGFNLAATGVSLLARGFSLLIGVFGKVFFIVSILQLLSSTIGKLAFGVDLFATAGEKLGNFFKNYRAEARLATQVTETFIEIMSSIPAAVGGVAVSIEDLQMIIRGGWFKADVEITGTEAAKNLKKQFLDFRYGIDKVVRELQGKQMKDVNRGAVNKLPMADILKNFNFGDDKSNRITIATALMKHLEAVGKATGVKPAAVKLGKDVGGVLNKAIIDALVKDQEPEAAKTIRLYLEAFAVQIDKQGPGFEKRMSSSLREAIKAGLGSKAVGKLLGEGFARDVYAFSTDAQDSLKALGEGEGFSSFNEAAKSAIPIKLVPKELQGNLALLFKSYDRWVNLLAAGEITIERNTKQMTIQDRLVQKLRITFASMDTIGTEEASKQLEEFFKNLKEGRPAATAFAAAFDFLQKSFDIKGLQKFRQYIGIGGVIATTARGIKEAKFGQLGDFLRSFKGLADANKARVYSMSIKALAVEWVKIVKATDKMQKTLEKMTRDYDKQLKISYLTFKIQKAQYALTELQFKIRKKDAEMKMDEDKQKRIVELQRSQVKLERVKQDIRNAATQDLIKTIEYNEKIRDLNLEQQKIAIAIAAEDARRLNTLKQNIASEFSNLFSPKRLQEMELGALRIDVTEARELYREVQIREDQRIVAIRELQEHREKILKQEYAIIALKNTNDLKNATAERKLLVDQKREAESRLDKWYAFDMSRRKDRPDEAHSPYATAIERQFKLQRYVVEQQAKTSVINAKSAQLDREITLDKMKLDAEYILSMATLFKDHPTALADIFDQHVKNLAELKLGSSAGYGVNAPKTGAAIEKIFDRATANLKTIGSKEEKTGLFKKSTDIEKKALAIINQTRRAKTAQLNNEEILQTKQAKANLERLRTAVKIADNNILAIKKQAELSLDLNDLNKQTIIDETNLKIAGAEKSKQSALLALNNAEKTLAAQIKLNSVLNNQFLKIIDDITGAIKTRLRQGAEDFFTAIEEGNLTMKNFKEGAKDLFIGLLSDVGKSVFNRLVMEPLEEQISNIGGSLLESVLPGVFGGAFIKHDGSTAKKALYVQVVGGSAAAGNVVQGASNDIEAKLLAEKELNLTANQTATAAIAKSTEGLNFFGQAAANGGAAVTEAGSQIALGFAQITTGAGSFAEGLTNIFSGAFKGITGLAQSILGKLGGAVFGSGAEGSGLLSGIGSWLGGLFGGGGVTEGAGSMIGDFPISDSLFATAVSGGLISQIGAKKGIRHFASGGMQRDRMPALLEPGEFVMRKQAVAQAGVPAMQRMNAGGMNPQKVSINVVNEGQPKEGESGGIDITPEQIVVDVILRDLKNNGAIRRGIREQT